MSKGKFNARRASLAAVAVTVTLACLAAAAASGGIAQRAAGPTLKIAFAGVPGALDTAQWQGQVSNDVFSVFGQGMTLVRYKGVGRPVSPPAIPKIASETQIAPGLAKSWKQTRRGVVLVLRHAISGYGNPLTSADVQWTFERDSAIDPISQFLFSNASIDVKKPVSILGPSTVRINTTKFNPQTIVTLTSDFFRIYDSKEVKSHATSADPWAKQWLVSHSADFSAWIVSSFAPNSNLVLQANPHYWGKKPKFKTAIIRAIPDPGNRLQLIKSGTVDIAGELSFDQFASLASDKAVKRVGQPGVGFDVLSLDFGFKPFAKRSVRQAVSMAINRAALVRGVYKGFGKPATDQLFNVTHPPSRVSRWYKYNPSAAKQLLANAGYKHGFTFTLVVSPSRPGPYSSEIGVFLKSQLAKIGIKVKLQTIASAADYQNLVATGKPDAFLYQAGALYNDPGFFISVWHYSGPGGLQDYKGYKSKKVNQLVKLMNAAPLGKRRDRYVSRADAILNKDVAWVPLVSPVTPMAFSSKLNLSHFRIYPVGMNIEELAPR